MSEQKLSDHLEHMDEAAKLACSFVNEMQKIDFLADKRTQQAVILNIMIIGEAATKLLQNHADFLERHPNLPWRSMKGMRNRVAHGYFDIAAGGVAQLARPVAPGSQRTKAFMQEHDQPRIGSLGPEQLDFQRNGAAGRMDQYALQMRPLARQISYP